jgi:thiamine biosynthesis lipoprotein
VAAGCAPREPVEVIETREAMNTLVTVRAVAVSDSAARRALDAAWKEMDEGIKHLDRHLPDSDISRVNRDAGRFTIEVDPLVTSCLSAAREVYDMTGGAFDPTVGPLLELWRKAQERNQLPTEEELSAARALVGMDAVQILAFMAQKPLTDLAPLPPRGGPTPKPEDLVKPMYLVGLDKEGMALDLGGIAKGYIVGRMAQRMVQSGVFAALVDAGGDVYAEGQRPLNLVAPGSAGAKPGFAEATPGGDPSTGSGSPRAGSRGDRRWGVGVQDPRYPEDRTRLFTAVHVRDQAVVTSGHYARGYTVEGRRFSHIVDPRTGWPVDTRLASVTVVAPDAAMADGLATGIAVLGIEKGMELVEKTDGVECLLLELAETPDDGAEPPALIAHRSSGFAALEFDPSATGGPLHPGVRPAPRK